MSSFGLWNSLARTIWVFRFYKEVSASAMMHRGKSIQSPITRCGNRCPILRMRFGPYNGSSRNAYTVCCSHQNAAPGLQLTRLCSHNGAMRNVSSIWIRRPVSSLFSLWLGTGISYGFEMKTVKWEFLTVKKLNNWFTITSVVTNAKIV